MEIRLAVTKKDIESLYGEALCNIQLLEDAISHSITLKKDVKSLHKDVGLGGVCGFKN